MAQIVGDKERLDGFRQRIPSFPQKRLIAVQVVFPYSLWHLLGQRRPAILAAEIHKAPPRRKTGGKGQAKPQGL